MGQQCARAFSELFPSNDPPDNYELLRLFIHNHSDGVIFLDLEQRVLDINHACEVMNGWTREELFRKLMPLTPPHLLGEAWGIHDKVIAGEQVDGYETYNLRKDGALIAIRVTISPLRDRQGKIIAIVRIESEISTQNNDLRLLIDKEDDTQKLLDHALEPILVYTDDIIKYANTAAINFIGANHKEEVIDRSIFDIFPHAIIQHLVSNGTPSEIMENKLVRLDKREIDIQVKAIAIDYRGTSSIQLVCRDISMHKKTEKALCEAESLYKGLVDHTRIGIYLGQAGQTIYTNTSLSNMFGYTSQEFITLDTRKLTFEEDWIQLLEEARKMMIDKNSKFHFYIRGKKKDQSIINLEGIALIITHNGEPAVFVTLHDVTYKREKEELLFEYAQSYQRLVKFLPEPIVLKVAGVIAYANLSALKLIKASNEDQVIGRSTFDFIHQEHHEEMRVFTAQLLQTDEPLRLNNQKLICLDGDVIVVEIASIRIHNFMDKVATLTVIRDLTEQKRTEELLIQSEKLSVIGQLAAGVAHEIRNPLTALRGFCQLLKGRYGDQVHYLDIMLNELDRINLIVNEFMTLAKPHITQFADQSVNEILSSVLAILETQATLVNVNMETLLSEQLPDIYCDKNQLKQVFINVIKNAIEAMPQGGTVTIKTLINADDQICIQIIDEGKGIANEIIAKIGSPFFTTKASGTGLGLMICKQIINAHRGLIHIFSKIDQGTTVEIVLPPTNNS